ncbi:MAG: hypothetical protein LBJ11_07810 [Oscillospiraceae bacterium]|jgi:glycerophosphoryl diester phosphodiesterase|nr:hypothetical protein [Oscillospiraceae bacterium]
MLPRRFAHRGVAQAAPENTLPAFQAAADLGLEGIELDVRLTKDGVPVVIHDGNLTRLTCGHPARPSNARVRDLTWDELSRVELPYANHTLTAILPPQAENEFLALRPDRVLGGETDYITALARDGRMAGIPRLADVLDWLAALPVPLEAEIELCANDLVRPVFELLDGHPALPRCIVFTGNPAIIEEMQDLAAGEGKPAGLRLGANIRVLNDDVKEDVEGLDLFEVGLNARLFGREDVAWLQDRNIAVLSNLGDAPDWWEQLCALDAYGFKTNYAQAFTTWRSQR